MASISRMVLNISIFSVTVVRICVLFIFYKSERIYIWENNNNYKTIHLLEVPYTYMGCFEDSSVLQDLPVTTGDARATPSTCRRVCYLADYRYAAVSRGNWCHCECVLFSSITLYFYRPQRSCEGYVFTGVCLSTVGGVLSQHALQVVSQHALQQVSGGVS